MRQPSGQVLAGGWLPTGRLRLHFAGVPWLLVAIAARLLANESRARSPLRTAKCLRPRESFPAGRSLARAPSQRRERRRPWARPRLRGGRIRASSRDAVGSENVLLHFSSLSGFRGLLSALFPWLGGEAKGLNSPGREELDNVFRFPTLRGIHCDTALD